MGPIDFPRPSPRPANYAVRGHSPDGRPVVITAATETEAIEQAIRVVFVNRDLRLVNVFCTNPEIGADSHVGTFARGF